MTDQRAVREPVDPRHDRMPRWVPRAIALLMVGIAVLYSAFWIANRLRNLLVLLLIALFLSLAVEPAVNALAHRGWRRGAATGLVFGAVLLLVGLFAVAIGSLFVSQVVGLVNGFPEYVEAAAGYMNGVFNTDLSGGVLAEQLRASEAFQNLVQGVAVTAVGAGTSLVGVVFQGLTVGLFAFYLAADGPRLRRTICSVLPPQRQKDVLAIWEMAIAKTGGYVYSRMLLATASAAATWLVLALLGTPYPLALGLWVGLVSQFVPTVGTYLAGAVPVLVALLSDPRDALWVLVFILVYQQVENYLLAPRVTAQTMSLNPAVAFGAVIAGASLLGGVGALLALPAAASIQALISTYLRRYEVIGSRLVANAPPAAGPERRSRRRGGPRRRSAARART